MQSYWMQLSNHNYARMGADGLVILELELELELIYFT